MSSSSNSEQQVERQRFEHQQYTQTAALFVNNLASSNKQLKEHNLTSGTQHTNRTGRVVVGGIQPLKQKPLLKQALDSYQFQNYQDGKRGSLNGRPTIDKLKFALINNISK